MGRSTESAQAMAVRIMNDPTASFWLKKAVDAVMHRDCVDAANDAEALLALCNKLCADPIHTSR